MLPDFVKQCQDDSYNFSSVLELWGAKWRRTWNSATTMGHRSQLISTLLNDLNPSETPWSLESHEKQQISRNSDNWTKSTSLSSIARPHTILKMSHSFWPSSDLPSLPFFHFPKNKSIRKVRLKKYYRIPFFTYVFQILFLVWPSFNNR